LVDDFAIVVEDDGRVGFAYLVDHEGHIRADVWLYNRCAAPERAEWSDAERAPFANPAEFASHESVFALPESELNVSVDWDAGKALILIDGALAGVLVDGSKPGWAANALRDGPLAKVLKT
jgi:predicted NAD/FAD-dependent oxidoreductase